MPLEHASEGSAGFKKNIKTEMGAGKPQRQAVAIAYKEAGEDEAEQQAGPLKEPAEPSEGFGGVVDALMGMAGDEDDVHDSAGLILRAPDGKVLFLKRGPTANNPGKWDWPGGHVQAGETLAQGAIRETHEECGYHADPDDLHELSRKISGDIDFTAYICPVKEKFTPNISRDEDGGREHDDWIWADLRDLPEPLHPSIKDALSDDFVDEIIETGRSPPAAAAEDGAGKPEHVIEIEVSGEFCGPLALWLATVGNVAAQGHSFDLEADRADGEGFSIGIDGDGADRILRVRVDGQIVKPPKPQIGAMDEAKWGVIAAAFDEMKADGPGVYVRRNLTAKSENWAEEKGYRATADDAAWAPLIAAMDAMRDDALLLAVDKASLRDYDSVGRLKVALTPISKANVCPYMGKEIPHYAELGLSPNKIYRLLRDPAELEKAASTFNLVPVLEIHTPTSAEDHPQEVTVGCTGTDAVFEFPYLMNSMGLWMKDAIEDVESEFKRELSSSYEYDLDLTPGIFEGETYDGRMINIKGNHVALVEAGRAGADVLVVDSFDDELKWALVEEAIRECGYVPPSLAR